MAIYLGAQPQLSFYMAVASHGLRLLLFLSFSIILHPYPLPPPLPRLSQSSTSPSPSPTSSSLASLTAHLPAIIAVLAPRYMASKPLLPTAFSTCGNRATITNQPVKQPCRSKPEEHRPSVRPVGRLNNERWAGWLAECCTGRWADASAPMSSCRSASASACLPTVVACGVGWEHGNLGGAGGRERRAGGRPGVFVVVVWCGGIGR
ncbi:hypothetical protein HDK64DRAFT_146226 [Phyllosticta capitalensis]